ncbi:HPr family phosphocarrier protein [Oceanobacillus manasiensis]|uniref:HPr family phosphocarrier protein n=1 Tax=Oceanobacillus manasiensis TaxID=586413 RepID=UPI0005A66CCB|nr:HPr family phosphocarrier protein [Oceanobacillus manasiensis]
MQEKQVKVGLAAGLQARPAAEFVQLANRFSSHLYLEKEGKRVNAKSIMGLMSLAVASNEEIIILGDGTDEQEAIQELTAFVTE